MKLIAKKFPYFSDPELYYLLNNKEEAHKLVSKSLEKRAPVIVYSVPIFLKIYNQQPENYPPEWWLADDLDLPQDGWIACISA